jgi:hypothetical protein
VVTLAIQSDCFRMFCICWRRISDWSNRRGNSRLCRTSCSASDSNRTAWCSVQIGLHPYKWPWSISPRCPGALRLQRPFVLPTLRSSATIRFGPIAKCLLNFPSWPQRFDLLHQPVELAHRAEALPSAVRVRRDDRAVRVLGADQACGGCAWRLPRSRRAVPTLRVRHRERRLGVARSACM